MSTLTPEREHHAAPAPRATRLSYLTGVGTLFGLELRQRLRSRGWYIMLAIWFVVILLVTLAVGASVNGFDDYQDPSSIIPGSASAGQIQFELVIAFVLVFGALVAPVFAANSVSGDRAGGTLAIVQATLVTPGQILWGKWLAAWVAALAFLVAAIPAIAVAILNGQLRWGYCLLMLLGVAVELGILCAMGVGVSAVTTRPLFSILATYLVVALLGIGTLIATGIAAITVTEEVRESSLQQTAAAMKAEQEFTDSIDESTGESTMDYPEAANERECGTEVNVYQAPATERFTWLLAANPVVLLADFASPGVNEVQVTENGYTYTTTPTAGPLTSVKLFVRTMQAGPQAQVTCLQGKELTPLKATDQAPVWPLGLAVQLVIAGALVFWGRSKLVTPAGRLTQGTRVA